jgi:hypothetical protein
MSAHPKMNTPALDALLAKNPKAKAEVEEQIFRARMKEYEDSLVDLKKANGMKATCKVCNNKATVVFTIGCYQWGYMVELDCGHCSPIEFA